MNRIAEGGIAEGGIAEGGIAEGGILLILNKLKTFEWKYNQPHKHVSHISIKERRSSGDSGDSD